MSIASAFAGHLVDDLTLRYAPSGVAVAHMRVAVNDRKHEDGRWVDGDTSYITVNVFGAKAEHCAASLMKGTRVVVLGRGKQRDYETKDGDKRSVFEVDADSIGPDLTFATATVTRATRSGGARPAQQPAAGVDTADETATTAPLGIG